MRGRQRAMIYAIYPGGSVKTNTGGYFKESEREIYHRIGENGETASSAVEFWPKVSHRDSLLDRSAEFDGYIAAPLIMPRE